MSFGIVDTRTTLLLFFNCYASGKREIKMGYTHGTSIESKTRICTKCGKEFPNTNEFFSYANKKLGRLNALCKECQKIISKEKRLKIIEKNKNKDLFYSGTRHCKKCNRDLPNNKL